MGELDLKWAVGQYKGGPQRAMYSLARAYDDGDHRLSFATDKFRSTFGHLFKEFAENVCPGVVDALNDRLDIQGFKSSESEMGTEDVKNNSPAAPTPAVKRVTINDPMGDLAQKIWERNQMDVRSSEVHRESLLMGDAYVIVWPDDDLQASIFPQVANECSVQYDPNTPGKVIRGSKVWYDELEEVWRLNVYTLDAIEKYASRKKARTMPQSERSWISYGANVPNPYGVNPMFHLPNRRLHCQGISELRDIIPIQDALNKSVMDMLIAMEFASFKQRYVIGMETPVDEETGQPEAAFAKNYGVDRLLTIPEPEASVGQFDATDLTQFLKVQEKFWASVARVSGTPLHYFYIVTGDFPSGEAMKAAEARFVKKISDQQVAKGSIWEQVLLFAMRIEETIPDDLEMEIMWKDPAPRTESELADTAVKKKAVGVSRSQILKEFGYTDDEIERMLEESDAQAKAQSDLMAEQKMAGSADPNNPAPNGATPAKPTSGTQGVRR